MLVQMTVRFAARHWREAARREVEYCGMQKLMGGA